MCNLTSSADQQSSTNQNADAGGRARALYDFTSDCDEELSLKVQCQFNLLPVTLTSHDHFNTCSFLPQVGDIVTGLESVDDEWFLGDLRGKRALVPKNYVQVLE